MNSLSKKIFSLIFTLLFAAGTAGTSPTVRGAAESVQTAAGAAMPRSVIPGGKSIGVILSTDGVTVASVAEFETEDGRTVSPAKEAGIAAGDFITELNGQRLKSVAELNKTVEKLQGEGISAEVVRRDKKINLLITPQKAKDDGKYRIGAWIKDAASGIGTLSFYDPQSHGFAALGHGICSTENGNLLSVDNGSILASTIVSVRRGEKGIPGELKGVFQENKEVLGSILKNSECGIYGRYYAEPENAEKVPIAAKGEVHTGAAQILADVEGSRVRSYGVEILRVMPDSRESSKSMVIKICDEELINKTGGIVQGMSGSPIIQDGKLIGAITHVFVNDPTRGYGIFAERMLDNLVNMS